MCQWPAKARASWPVIAPILAGTSLDLNHFSHGETIAVGSFLLVGIVGVAVARVRARRAEANAARSSPPEKLSASLVALSSAAVLAIYSAGYWRTRAAEQQYVQQAEMHRLAIASRLNPPAPTPPATATSPAARSAPPPQPTTEASRKRSRPQPEPQRRLEAGIPAPLPPQGSAAPPSPSAGGLPVGISTDDPSVLAGNTLPNDNSSPSAPAAPASQAQWKDGTYLGWGSCRHGDIQAAVVVKSGRIASAAVAQCWTRYSCSVIFPLYGQVVSHQSAEQVDTISGATESSEAFFAAIIDALAKAK